MFDTHGAKFSLEFPSHNIDDCCIICGAIQEDRTSFFYCVHGESKYDSFWLRKESGTPIQVCYREECFNLLLLNVEKYIQIPF